ncbi:TPA: CBS domain-containing protein [Candidatus Micrarchaeota archaeon]|nr:CBS domain-containing protein [Candidatus Micrarchaeota archaeon]
MHDLRIEKIGEIRRVLGLTQSKLAKLSGVSQSLIAKIESRKIDPAYSKVIAIFEALENRKKQSKEGKKAKEIMTHGIVGIAPTDNLEKAMKIMRSKDISQLPVIEQGIPIGSISDSMFADWMEKYGEHAGKVAVKEVMESGFPSVPENAEMELVTGMLKFYKAVLVKNGSRISGIITRADLIKAMK